ncbi:MAG TPA: serine hydrolase domain-containing protein [Acidimicrobiales bacterium]|nr:serine hydrolase domain-containing protein [Acidimicrobiales bacterium]
MEPLEVKVDPSSVGLSESRLARITGHFDRYVADRRLPGWLATVSRGGDLAWVGRGGYRDREAELPVSDDTIWRIYSMTKPFTTIAAMSLYEEGFFDLNDDVGQWVEELREPRVFIGGTPDEPETRPANGPVTVFHLLSHTSGLTYGFQRNHHVDAIYRANGYDFGWPHDVDLARAVHDWCTFPLLFEPGSRWNYSVSTDVLGHLIEIWTGKSLDAVVHERVIEPLGLTDTEWWCPEDKHSRLAALYVPGADGATVFDALGRGAKRPPQLLGGGGGLVSTARDYDRLMAMLVRGGELEGTRVLSRRTLELMTVNHLPGGADLTTCAEDSYAEVDYAGQGFGLGFSVVTDPVANRSLLSKGTYLWGGAASTLFWVDPLEELTVAFFTQLLPTGTYPLRRDLQQLVYGALTE